jgi:hypothetical protein
MDFRNKLELFVLGKPFQPSLMFVGKARAYPRVELHSGRVPWIFFKFVIVIFLKIFCGNNFKRRSKRFFQLYQSTFKEIFKKSQTLQKRVWVKQRIRSPLTPTYFPFLFRLTKPSPPAGNTLNGMLRRTHTLFYPDPYGSGLHYCATLYG